MSKKLLILLIILIIPLSLTSCNIKIGKYTINNFQVTKQKPITSYYTEELSKKIYAGNSFKAVMLDMNLYKEINLSQADLETVKNFFTDLKKSNFLENYKDFKNKPVYKLFLSFDKDKYVINIYNEKYIAVYPWDGDYPMDFIDTENIQPLYSLFGLCKYLMPK